MPYIISKNTLAPLVKLWLGKIQGEENIPKDKPFIIAANHSSYYETLLIPTIIFSNTDRKMHAWVNSEYWDFFITRIILDIWECIPVYVGRQKNTKENNKKALKKALFYLKKEDIMIVFPEGKRSKDGKLQKAYTGIAKLALSSKVPVLPIGVINSNKVLPRGAVLPRFKKCEVKIGKLMHFSKYYGKKISNQAFENVTRSIMKEIARLTNQKYNY